MSVQTALQLFNMELLIAMIGGSAFAMAGGIVGMHPDDITTLWCIVGGCLGAFCSLHFFRVPPSDHLASDIKWQFAVNLVLSAVFSPLCVPYLVRWSGLRDMQVAIAVSCGVGIAAQQIVSKIILPWGQKILDARAAKVAKEMGVDACPVPKPTESTP